MRTDIDREPRHGQDGWVLEDMEWSPDTGGARLEYSRAGRTCERHVLQPAVPEHEGWSDRPFQDVLQMDRATLVAMESYRRELQEWVDANVPPEDLP